MRKREQRPVQLDPNDHEALKHLASECGLSMNTLVHRLIRILATKAQIDPGVPDKCYLPRYAIFELLHLRDIGRISEEELAALLNNEGAKGIVLDMLWAEGYREKREILDRYDVLRNKFV